MHFKIKVIENELPAFEEEINDFVSKRNVEVLDIKYSTSGLSPDEEYGWHTTNMHNSLITYRELVFDDNAE